MYKFQYARTLIYMLQSTEYQVDSYLAWFWRTTDFSSVAKRRQLEKTGRARKLLVLLRVGMGVQIIIGALIFWLGLRSDEWNRVIWGSLIVCSYPLVWAHAITLPLIVARQLVVRPKERRLVASARKRFADTKAVKIAVAGSYGKTTMKELLKTVLSEGKIVAATPANKNVATSHAHFVSRLTGKEEVLIIEYGEGKPGDVERFNATVQPTIGIITGLAPAHLDQYKTLEAAGRDIFSLAKFVGHKNVFINGESEPAKDFIDPADYTYSSKGVLGWTVSRIKVDVTGTSFTIKKGTHSLKLKSGVIGRHLIGSLALCVALADELGLTDEQITRGVAMTLPFEHRMQPRLLAGGWIIDDTYNGNLEGVRAGLALLHDLKTERKTYVTPGLVDQGDEAEKVHIEVGRLIAAAHPQKVVLMQNSVTQWIQQGLTEKKFKGEVSVEADPLRFYTNLEHYIAVGDVILMQNDWTDNYA